MPFSVVTSETEEFIVRGDLQAGEAAGIPGEETAAVGMDFSAAIVVAQDEIDRHDPDSVLTQDGHRHPGRNAQPVRFTATAT